MEYLRGLTLKDLIKTEGPSSPRRVAHIVKQILKSLSEAHSIGIVHRDLKPANIVLADMHGETDFVKVLDFGIAKLMDQQEDDDEQLTSAGMLVGTLHYMAPEQITGLPLGPFTDIYALGLIMAHMLTGSSLFSGVQRWDILQLQIGDEMLPFDEQIASTPLGQIAVKSLQKKAEHRYQTCAEMLEAIEALTMAELSPLPLVGENSASSCCSRTRTSPQ